MALRCYPSLGANSLDTTSGTVGGVAGNAGDSGVAPPDRAGGRVRPGIHTTQLGGPALATRPAQHPGDDAAGDATHDDAADGSAAVNRPVDGRGGDQGDGHEQ